jgi:hypothetical protein
VLTAPVPVQARPMVGDTVIVVVYGAAAEGATVVRIGGTQRC